MAADGSLLLPRKLRWLNQLPVVNVHGEAPLGMNNFGEFDVVPPVVPKVNVRVTLIVVENPPLTPNVEPVLVFVKPVAVAMLNTVWAALV